MMPGISLSHKRHDVSGAMSRGPTPVPPVVMITSMPRFRREDLAAKLLGIVRQKALFDRWPRFPRGKESCQQFSNPRPGTIGVHARQRRGR